MGFSRQEYWSGLPCPSPGELPNPEIKPGSPTLQADSLLSEPPGKLFLKKNISFSERAYWAIQNNLKALNKGCWLITSIRVPPWGLKVQPHFPLLLRRTNSPKTKLEAPRIRPLQVGRHLFERDIFCTCRCWKLGLFWRVVKCSWVRGRSKQLMCHQDLQQAVMLWLGMVLPAKEEM